MIENKESQESQEPTNEHNVARIEMENDKLEEEDLFNPISNKTRIQISHLPTSENIKDKKNKKINKTKINNHDE